MCRLLSVLVLFEQTWYSLTTIITSISRKMQILFEFVRISPPGYYNYTYFFFLLAPNLRARGEVNYFFYVLFFKIFFFALVLYERVRRTYFFSMIIIRDDHDDDNWGACSLKRALLLLITVNQK